MPKYLFNATVFGGILVAVLMSAGCVTTGSAVKVTGEGDAFEGKVEVSTFDYERPFMGVVNPSDYYFRGYIDKKTGAKTYQLYTITNSVDWMRWDEARVLVDGQMVKMRAVIVASDAKCSHYPCAHYEDMVVNLKRDMLDAWSVSSGTVVRYASSRVSGKIDIHINAAEVLQFIETMDSVNLVGKQ